MLPIILPLLIFCGIAAVAAVLLTLLYPKDCREEQPTYWESVCWYFNSGKGKIRTRQGMFRYVEGIAQTGRGWDASRHTLDYYRRILTRAGYIKVISPGRYELVAEIPEGITAEHVRFTAYELDKLFEPIPRDHPGWSFTVK